jgi:hypothetical protein
MRRLDAGPQAESGVGQYPPRPGPANPNYLGAGDEDGNELGGIRLPDLSVPVATYTGWNPRHSRTGGPDQLIAMQGSTFPLPATAADRQRNGDPRRSIAERYRDRKEYLARVRAAAEQLAADRYFLPDDVDLVVRNAADRYDAFAARKVAEPAAAP